MLSDLRAAMLADGTIAGLVSSRIHPDTAPQNPTFPLAVYFVVSEVSSLHMRGPSNPVETRVQIDAWGLSKSDAEALGAAIKTKLHGFSGTVGSTKFQAIEADNSNSGFDPEVKRYFRKRDFIIRHVE